MEVWSENVCECVQRLAVTFEAKLSVSFNIPEYIYLCYWILLKYSIKNPIEKVLDIFIIK